MLRAVVRKRTPTDVRVRSRSAFASTLVFALVSSGIPAGCTPDIGQVELNWMFVDRNASPFIPSDLRKDSCAIPAQDADGQTSADLIVQLTLSEPDCPGGPAAESCQIAFRRSKCDRRRDTLDDVPASDDPYLMSVDIMVVPARGNRFLAPAGCIAVPGPRRRRVDGGALTDLSVYQFVVHNMDLDETSRLDLEQCRDPDA